MKKYFIMAFCLLVSCQPSSLEEFSVEGEGQGRLLLKELREIASREDLVFAEPLLKKRFEKMVDLMIQARTFEQKNPGTEGRGFTGNGVLNAALKEELERVYSLEGGRECIERAQN